MIEIFEYAGWVDDGFGLDGGLVNAQWLMFEAGNEVVGLNPAKCDPNS